MRQKRVIKTRGFLTLDLQNPPFTICAVRVVFYPKYQASHFELGTLNGQTHWPIRDFDLSSSAKTDDFGADGVIPSDPFIVHENVVAPLGGR